MKSKQPVSQNRGFALIITISMMVLMALLAVGLLSLSTVAMRTSGQGAAEAQARANAKLALALAIGDLQKAMGPDARISARGQTLARHPRLGVEIQDNSPKSWWVGVSNSDPEKGVGVSSESEGASPPVQWLISGLKYGANPGEQISAEKPFENPVMMYGDKTIDTAQFTGGQPITAGSVMISGDGGKSKGGFAYFIDDSGMKAQLAASSTKVRNDDDSNNPGGGVFPGTYDLSVLKGMEGLQGTAKEDYNRMNSINDLPLIGTDVNVVREKRFGYTTLSRGVLADVKEGTLKKDLTIAFENEADFAKAFPRYGRGNSFDRNYIVMDQEKLRQEVDLTKNGYIHWGIFKDYYNIKKYIQKKGPSGSDSLDSYIITKSGLFSGYDTPFGLGKLGPHAIGPNGDVPYQHQTLPYGEVQLVGTSTSNTNSFRHNPVMPVLGRMQQNAWLDYKASRVGKPTLKTNVQLWTSQYNPYNINLNIVGDGTSFGPRFINFPQIKFKMPSLTGREINANGSLGPTQSLTNIDGFAGKRQSSVPYQVMLGPGRAHVCAFRDSGAIGAEVDEGLFRDTVRDLTYQSIYRNYELSSPITGSVSFDVEFVLDRPSLLQGTNSNAHSANHEVAQVMWSPFSWDAIGGNRPGKRIRKTANSSATLNENTMASLSMHLRTTREAGSSVGPAIRPLVDANIRALLCNPKWDSPLGLPILAAYSAQDSGESEEAFFPMDTRDNPKGYSYWGGGSDPADGHDRVILFDIPREDLLSIGQLQHASAGRFSYEPTYIVGNSYANLRIPQKNWKTSIGDTFSSRDRGLAEWAIPGRFELYDASYLVNEVLWDSYIFTTIPQVADNYTRGKDPQPSDRYFQSLLEGEELLPNPRFIPYEPAGLKFNAATLQERLTTTGGFLQNAGMLMVDGAFNVNSISVDAWEAFLTGTHQLPYQKLTERGVVAGFSDSDDVDGVRFPRVKSVMGKGWKTDNPNENYWTGFRDLEQEEVRDLAKAIVEQIKKRGPFLTMGEFVNRKLEDGELGARGALQAALDATVNGGLDSSFEESANFADIPDDSTQGAGFPGQLLQGDILQALSPYMTVRSDTFTIRAYGEARSASGDKIEARAWCEATVQRFPDPVEVSSGAKGPLLELIKPSSEYGRTFRVISFRWLSPAEI